MSTGAWHYAEAERLIAQSHDSARDAVSGKSKASAVGPAIGLLQAEAKVHAILALAAATALGREGGDGRMPARDRAAWFDVAAVPRHQDGEG